ncbi:MAG: hypothetical protein IPK58_13265 [Acidobacteria bacterium]|nr:hypothetical protein [Acidobacteriota bacterium]
MRKPSFLNSRRYVATAICLAIIATVALASNLTRISAFSGFAAFFGASERVELPVNPGPLMTIGTCDTAGPIEIESSGGTTTPTAYATLKAAFDAINLGTHTGTIGIDVCGDTDETTVSAILNASGSGAASYTSVAISPAGGSARTITGATVAGSPLIDFNGADNVTINGLNTGGNSLTIANTTVSASSGTSTIRLQADATNNTITNSSILGSSTMATTTNGGNIWFGAGAVAAGNDNNIISNNNIGPAGANLPTKLIYGNGSTTTTAVYNSGNQITGNNLFDYFNVAAQANAVYLAGGNTGWTISNNRIYQTATRTQTTGAILAGIQAASSTGNDGHTISGNVIGFANSAGTGTTNFVGSSTGSKFLGIYISSASTLTPSSIQGNTIAGINMSGIVGGTSTTASFVGISINSGVANIGNVTGNTIGSLTSAGSVSITNNNGSASEIFGIYYFPSAVANVSNNNVGGIVSNNSGVGSVVFYGIRAFTASAVTNTMLNNTIGSAAAPITNTTASTSSRTIGLYCQSGACVATGNTIGNLSMSAANVGTGSAASVIGLWIDNSSATIGNNVAQNTVRSLANNDPAAAVWVTGMQYNGATTGTHTVQRNFIHTISAPNTTSATATVNGINVQGGLTTYQNNMVALGGNMTANSPQINGIAETIAGTDNFYHNSVYIGGTGVAAGTANSFAFQSSITLNTRNFRNNIFFNARSNGAATSKHYAIQVGGTAPAPGGLTSNNNILFANGTGGFVGRFNLIDQLTLANWQSATGNDANSFSVDPQFNAATAATPDLHLHPTNPTVAEGNGADVGVIDDFDGQTRASLTPVDIGADAGNYSGIDLAGPGISYTALANTASTGNRVLSVTLTDVTGVATGGNAPRVYFNKNAGAYSSTGCALSTGTVNNGVWDCTIDNSLVGGVVATDTVRYFVVAQDTLGNLTANPSSGFSGTNVNTVTTPPTSPNQYLISVAYSGSINVGASETITSLTNVGGLFEAVNNGVLTGNVTVNLTSDLTAETGTVALNQWAEDGAGNYTLLIKPSGAPRTVSGTNTGALIKLNGADRVRIDGSTAAMFAEEEVAGGNPALRELTIQNTNTGTSAVVINVGSGTNGAQNNTIKNVNVLGQDPTTTLGGILLGGNTPGTVGTDNDGNRVENCTVKRSIYGIYSAGASAANQNTGTVITLNDLSATTTDRVRRVGIVIFNDNGAQITDNSIATETNESADAIGIGVGTQGVDSTVTTSGSVTGALVARNKINGIASLSTVGFSAAGIAVAGGAGTANTIVNNMITGVTAPSTSPDLVAGVFVIGATGSSTRVYNNSVAMTGDRGAVATQMPSFGIAVTGADPTVELKNNNFYTSQIASGGGVNAKSYAIGMVTTTFANLDSNYNDFFSTGANAGFFRSGSLGAAAGTDYATLALWQAAVADDANSQEIDPTFVNPLNDLHLQAGSGVANDGITIAAVTDDFDGETRLSPPEIGADELPSPGVLEFSGPTYSVGEAGPTVTITVSRTLGSAGAVSVDYATGGGTATGGAACGAGVDYVNASSTLNFANGETSKTFDVTVCDDALFEGNETVNLTLSNPTGGATLGMQTTAALTITDNDAQPSMEFSSATYTITEGLAENLGTNPTATITVTRSGATENAVSVNFATVAGGTATGGASCTAGVDYINNSGTLNFVAGDVSETFSVTTCVDSVFEGNETVNLALTSPTGGVLGMQDTAVLTITENDPAFCSTMQPVEITAPLTGYATLKAAFDAINAGTHTGAIQINICGNTTEAASAVLNASGTGSASYSSVAINPSGGGARTVSGSFVGALVDLNGADNVTIDGLNTGGNSLTFSNAGLGASSTIKFANDATANTVTKITAQGSGDASFGVIYFGTGTTTGNDNNAVTDSNITAAGANLPLNGVYSFGSSVSIDNSGNAITGNNISDFFNASSASNGLNINSNNDGWTISNNKIFQTAPRTYTTASTHNGINVTSGSGYTVSGNTIGYAAANGTGVYTMGGTIATRFVGINLGVGTNSATSVQGNTVASISLATSSGASTSNGVLCGLSITSGNVNVGNVTPNTFGATTGLDSLVATPTTTGGSVVGINSSSLGTVLIANNTFGAFRSSSPTATVAGGVFGITISGSAASMTITGNTIGNATAENMRAGVLGTTTGASFASGINQASASIPVISNYSNNTIQNFSSYGTSTSGFVRGIQTGTTSSATATATISNNIINNLITSGAVSSISSANAAAQGIQFLPGINSTISGNRISNISAINAGAVATVVAGITHGSATNTVISNNVIYGLSNASTTTSATLPAVVTGIAIRSGTGNLTIQNNMISIGNGQTTNTIFAGIWGNHGSTPDPVDRIYYNTVNIEGTVASGAYSTMGFMRGDFTATARTMTVDVRNNIFNNTRSGGTGKHYAIANNLGATTSATGWPAGASNNNVLNANPLTVGFWAADQTFAGWKAASSSDGASYSGIPVTFVNNVSDLHLNMGLTPTSIESGGVAVPGITTDIDGQTRPGPTGSVNGGAFAPDIGADEFDGVFLDGVAPLITYTPLANASTTGNRTLSVNISDFTGVASGGNSPRIYFKKSTDASYVSTACTLSSGTPQNGAYNCLIDLSLVGGGSGSPGDTIQYFVVAQDTVGNLAANPGIGFVGVNVNTVTTPPSPPSSYIISLPYTGTYTVGTGGSFTSLTNPGGLFEALNAGVATGNLTINITSDLTAETGTVALNQLTEEGVGGYTLTIKPFGGPRTISGANASGLLRFVDADRVTIDGSTTGGTANQVGGNAALRELTVQNTSTTATAGAVIAFGSSVNGAQNNTVRNVNVLGQDPTQTLIGIHMGAVAPGNSGTDNDNNRIENCSFKRSFIGIFNNGISAANPNTGNVITMNDLSATGADRMRRAGIFFFNQNGIEVTMNSIGGIVADEGADAIGIIAGIQNVTSTSTTGGGVFNALIARNKISGIASTSTTGFSAAGIAIAGDPAGANTIVNNMISGISAPSTSPDITAGIFVAGVTGSNTKVYFNSVSMTGDRDAVASQMPSFGIALAGDVPVELRNNVFYTTQTSSGGGVNAKSYAIGTLGTTFANLDSNYNAFFASGANAGFFRSGSLAAGAGTDYATLALWQAAVADDANSLFVDPAFVNPVTDLHLQAVSPVISQGTTVAGVTNDIDGQTRDATPDIGADEKVLVPGTLAFSSATYSVGEGAGTVTLTVNRTGGTDGAVGATYALGGGTATGGASCGGAVDYVNTGGTVSLADGEASKTFNVAVCDDVLFETSETFDATLSLPTGGATIGSPNPATVTITENDSQPSIQLSAASYYVRENALTLTANATRSGATGNAVGASFGTITGTATAGASCTAGVDYITASGTVSFAAGETTKPIVLTVCLDFLYECNESFGLSLSAPTGGAVIGTPNPATVRIVNAIGNRTDFDGDGRSELAIYRTIPSGTSQWWWRRTTNNNLLSYEWGLEGDVLTPADYDGDGTTDISVWRPGAANVAQFFILNSSNNTVRLELFGQTGDDPTVVGDFDGDRKADIAVFRAAAQGTFFYRGSLSNPGGNTTFIQWGTTGDKATSGDFNGNGKADFAVWRAGTWWILSDSFAVTTINFGTTGDKLVPGDYDGDGRTDAAVFRPSEGQWYVLRSSNGLPQYQLWGIATDVPVPADYDGDGQTDFAIYRDGVWYVLSSWDNSYTTTNFGLGTDIPIPFSTVTP